MQATLILEFSQAVIKETLRLFPAAGLGMPRVVPKGGLTLAGRAFPEDVRAPNLSFAPLNRHRALMRFC